MTIESKSDTKGQVYENCVKNEKEITQIYREGGNMTYVL